MLILYFVYFTDLFNALEEKIGNTNGSNLGICSYGISMTTLEEVFLELGRYDLY